VNLYKESFIRDLEHRGIHAVRVLAALRQVPREEFVQERDVERAYGDHPLPIGHGQTISQPYMVAVMTQLLQVNAQHRVLEIGTGCGYQTAVLGELAKEVYSVERIQSLHEQARERLSRLGYDRVHLCCGDGYQGWIKHAPYDRIMVTCAPDHQPPALLEQLADGGRMVIPVGPAGQFQVLWLIKRVGKRFNRSREMGVAFVPMVQSQKRA